MSNTGKITAPFTDAQVKALNAWQDSGNVRPVTCGGTYCSEIIQNGKHFTPKDRELIATTKGWVCICGKYRQNWAHAYMVEPWRDVAYQRIVGAESSGDNIVVHFENGETVEVATKLLIPVGFSGVKWDDIKYSPFDLIAPSQPEALHIPWDTIRVLTDKQFSLAMQDADSENKKQVGTRLKSLREKSGIPIDAMAFMTGFTEEKILAIENGEGYDDFKTLRILLSAMDYTLKDLALPADCG